MSARDDFADTVRAVAAGQLSEGHAATTTHGASGPSANAYKSGCRCPACTEAQRVKQNGLVAELAARPRDQVPHGRYGYSNWSCRCEVCRAAWSHLMALTRARRKQQAGRPMTPMETAALAAERRAEAS